MTMRSMRCGAVERLCSALTARATALTCALACAIAFGACHFASGHAPCASSTECGAGSCVRGLCTPPCTNNDGCPAQSVCTDGLCVNTAPDPALDGGVPDGGVDGCVDADGDGAGIGAACEAIDCDDTDLRRGPAHSEECDALDNDCDGVIDNGSVCGCIPLLLGDDEDPRLLCLGGRTYDDAVDECRSRGYRLIVLDTQVENDLFKATTPDHLLIWIGLDDLLVDGEFRWSDGSPLGFNDFDDNQPSGGGESCVQLRFGAWNDDECDTHLPFVCEPDPTLTAVPSGPCVDDDGDGRGPGCVAGNDCDDRESDDFALVGGAQDGDDDGFSSSIREVQCTPGDRRSRLLPDVTDPLDCDDASNTLTDTCELADCIVANPPAGAMAICSDATDFVNADLACTARFAQTLAKLNDRRDHDFASQLLLGHPNNFTNGWIGLNDIDLEGEMRWRDGDLLGGGQFNAFNPGEPDDFGGNEDCVRINDGGWNDDTCAVAHPFLCR